MSPVFVEHLRGRLREAATLDPSVNLARDALLLEGAVPLPAYRLWIDDECVVLGRHLVEAEEVDLAYARAEGIPILRRVSGGGAVFHDAGVLNYSIACDTDYAGWDLAKSLRRLSSPLLRVLEHIGLAWYWEGENNIYIGKSKVSGSAQARRSGRVLHHGSILVAADTVKLQRVLRPGGRSRHAPVANLRDFVPGMTVDRLGELLQEQLTEALEYL